MTIRKQLVKREIAGDVILVPVGDASLTLQGLLTLNETGELLWDTLPNAADEAALVRALTEAYEVDEATAQADVRAFMARLRELEIL